MKKRHLSRFFMGMLAMCAITACSDNELGNDPNVNPGDSENAVYMNVQVQLPVAGGSTRSETKPEGGTGITEIGKDYENAVNSVLLVLADKGNNFVAAGLGTNINEINSSKGIISSTAKIEKTELAAFYDNNGSVKDSKAEMKIYVFCNPTAELKKLLTGTPAPTGKDWIDYAGSIVEDAAGNVTEGAAIWGGADHKDGVAEGVQEGGFLMSTADSKSVTKKIPAKLEYWDDYTTADKAFDFSGVNFPKDENKKVDNSSGENNGNIKVERAVARFDFKDGSKGNQEYIIGEDENQNPTLKVKLTKMALVNMSKKFYYLRRVSDDGLPTGKNMEICGLEYDNGTTFANYVVDTDASEKNKGISTYQNHFNFCLGSNEEKWIIDEKARGQWRTYDIATVLGEKKEEDNTWDPTDKNEEHYYIWRYATENTIPDKDNQRHGITTGIVFKGKIAYNENNKSVPEDLKKALDEVKGEPEDAILYAYSNQLYVTWKSVRKHAFTAGADSEFYKAAFGSSATAGTISVDDDNPTYSANTDSPDYLWSKWQKNTSDEDALKKFKAAATKSLFTLYQSSTEEGKNPGYYCYYYYWNRHNDNNNPGVMGPMEFAVVRNNVYKLAVTKINRLGHPRLSENDPDPENPDKPDESDDVYLKLSVQVLPWVVRVNNIEF